MQELSNIQIWEELPIFMNLFVQYGEEGYMLSGLGIDGKIYILEYEEYENG